MVVSLFWCIMAAEWLLGNTLYVFMCLLKLSCRYSQLLVPACRLLHSNVQQRLLMFAVSPAGALARAAAC